MEFLHPAMWQDHNIDFVRWLLGYNSVEWILHATNDAVLGDQPDKQNLTEKPYWNANLIYAYGSNNFSNQSYTIPLQKKT